MGITALNAYSGQAGFYILENAALEASLDLPRGAYDIPLMLNSKRYTSTGNITNESAERTSTYGDTPSVNGQILPHFVVEPRKYRLRVLNAAASRTFNLTLNVDSTRANKKFHVVGSDSGFMSKPVETESLVVAMAERWEVCIPPPPTAAATWDITRFFIPY
jgi:bilirubin oxidase